MLLLDGASATPVVLFHDRFVSVVVVFDDKIELAVTGDIDMLVVLFERKAPVVILFDRSDTEFASVNESLMFWFSLHTMINVQERMMASKRKENQLRLLLWFPLQHAATMVEYRFQWEHYF